MDLYIYGLGDLTQIFINKNPSITLSEMKKEFINASAGIADDKIFDKLFPSIYRIEISKYMLNKSNPSDLFIYGLCDLIRNFINGKSSITLAQLKQKCLRISPDFINNVFFEELLPEIFIVEKYRHQSNNKNNTSSNT
jgi:hypothetical protein